MPDLSQAIELVDRSRSMSPSEAARHLFDQYRIAGAEFREEIVVALIGAFITGRARAQSSPSSSVAYRSDVRPSVVEPDATT